MRKQWTSDGWRRWFALFPIIVRTGPKREIVWLEWYWWRGMGLYVEISLTNPTRGE